MTSAQLANALIELILALSFELTEDSRTGGRPVAHFPSIDLAVVAFSQGKPPVAANVLFSRNAPEGIVADIAPGQGAVRNVRYLADLTDAAHESIAWRADADWFAIPWQPLAGNGEHAFVAPYPASLIKLMVLVGIARCVDLGKIDWEQQWSYGAHSQRITDWAEDMIVVSSNQSTAALVALLHHEGFIRRGEQGEEYNALNEVFADHGLATLRLSDTRADGGWTNGVGAGVGHLQMTAWDTARLLWLLDADAPPAPWLPTDAAPLVSRASRERIRTMLDNQALHEVLSSTLLAGLPQWQAGIPAQLPERWIQPDGSVRVADSDFPADVRGANRAAQVRFAHKTGSTENYAADAGIVVGLPPARRHYLIALISNLGSRYAPDQRSVTTWRIPALGAAIDSYLARQLEPAP